MDNEHPTLSVEDFAQKYGYPVSLIRLMIECGCPTQNGSVDFPTIVMWFLDNWEQVRRKAGLPELPTTEGLPSGAAEHAKIGNMFLTFTDYIASRASNEERKAAAADTSNFVREIMRERLDR